MAPDGVPDARRCERRQAQTRGARSVRAAPDDDGSGGGGGGGRLLPRSSACARNEGRNEWKPRRCERARARALQKQCTSVVPACALSQRTRTANELLVLLACTLLPAPAPPLPAAVSASGTLLARPARRRRRAQKRLSRPVEKALHKRCKLLVSPPGEKSRGTVRARRRRERHAETATAKTCRRASGELSPRSLTK